MGSPLASEVLSPTNFAWSHKLRVVLKGLPQGYIAWRRNTFDTLLRTEVLRADRAAVGLLESLNLFLFAVTIFTANVCKTSRTFTFRRGTANND